MIMLYESCGCLSCRKAKAWLEENGIEYRAKNILQRKLTFAELKMLFSQVTDIYDLISKRSTPMQNFRKRFHRDIEDLSFNEMVQFLQENPNALKRPILTNGKQLVVGWDEDEITVFLPRNKRKSYPGRVSILDL